MFSSFFFNDTATTEIYTLSLHDALPIYRRGDRNLVQKRLIGGREAPQEAQRAPRADRDIRHRIAAVIDHRAADRDARGRSEEHTSELQSRRDLVCRLLLEKKKKQRKRHT